MEGMDDAVLEALCSEHSLNGGILINPEVMKSIKGKMKKFSFLNQRIFLLFGQRKVLKNYEKYLDLYVEK